MRATQSLLSLALVPLLALAGPGLRAVAQENLGGNVSQDRRGETGERRDIGTQGEFGRPKAQTAFVGAGTTNGSTTGYSGPESNVQETPGQNSLPPLPSPDLCTPYRDTAAYQTCLWVVLRQGDDLGSTR